MAEQPEQEQAQAREREQARGERGGTRQPAPPVLEARGVAVTFPARRGHGAAHAVDDVNLTLGRGEVLALIGESGCGKSTLARALVGLVVPDRGEIRYLGKPLRRTRAGLREFRRHVQLVLQDPYGALNPRQNVHDAVAEGLRLHGQRAGLTRRVSEALDEVGMRPPEHFFDRYPHQLSGGQQQRVVIAGALTLGPDVLVADEPVSSLDASVRGEILKLFLQLRDTLGLAALVVSHDLGLAWNIADRVAVMYLGRIVEVGPVEDVLLRPQHPYTRALLDAVPSTSQIEAARVLRGEPPDPTRIPGGCRFHPRCPLRPTLDEAAAQQCLTDVPVLPPGVGEHAVACHHVTAPPAASRSPRDPSEVTP
ncbi:MAG TPA: ABC transporter ATP-binding protein [Nocardioides sp.]|uniref:ABC transporter ATP-binding protein n=1 Tax=Nocardioides sp. TaxID=35761 RepID=UPI002E3002FC|nr:ABC transporter ATP-binding protein [Nocardioides sp.]HEX3929352.1 ABC transporter ATP-binding protein [Nocardioides sp.]